MITETAYVSFALLASLLGAIAGAVSHYLRANFTMFPEMTFGNRGGLLTDLANDLFNSHSTTFEKHALGAEWDSTGYWDGDSLRNLAIYVIGGAASPVVIAIWQWPNRIELVRMACATLTGLGFQPPLCPAA